MPSDSLFLSERLTEAARYALMRRLLPAIRHNIAGALQPIGMMAAMLERRMLAALPDLPQLGRNSQALNTLSREAVAKSLSLMNWLAPKDNDQVALHDAIEEVSRMVSTELSLRGLTFVNQTEHLQINLPRGVVRNAFAACLMALTDSVEGPAEVVISASVAGNQLQLKVMLAPGGVSELAGLGGRAQSYRALDWDDARLLAKAEGVSLSHDAGGAELLWPLPVIADIPHGPA